MSAPASLTVPLALLPAMLGAMSTITAARGWKGTLSREGRLGVRSEAAVASDDAFVAANRSAAPVVAGAAVIGLLSAIALLVVPMSTAVAIVIGVFALVSTLALLVYGGILGDQVAQRVPRPARRPGGGGAGCGGCACGSGGCGGGSGLTRNAPAESGA